MKSFLRVLLIDDNPDDRDLARLALGREWDELHTVEVTDAGEFANALRRDGFDLVITDYELRWGNGLDVLAQTKSRFPQVPVIMFTDSGSEEVAVEAMKQGLDDYIVKAPHRYARLPVAARGVFSRREERWRAERLEVRLQEMEARQREFVRDVLASVTEGRLHLCLNINELPDGLPENRGEMELSPQNLRLFRRELSQIATQIGLLEDRVGDLVTGAGEAAMNAVTHGGVPARATFYADANVGQLQVWITDHGGGIAENTLHRATLERGFTTGDSFGHGFFLMLQTCDRIHLWTDTQGTTVVVEQAKHVPPPAFLR